MPRVSNVQKARAIGQIEAGMLQKDVAERLGVSPGTITKWKQKFRATGDVKDRPRSGRPKITTEQQDRYIRRLALQSRRRSSQSILRSVVRRFNTRVSDQTVRNCLHAANLWARKAAKKPAMTVRQKQERLRWCRDHLRWIRREWGMVMFSDESRFCLRKVDGRVKVWRRRGERFDDSCIDRVTPFGGGSVMVWGGISTAGKTELVVIDGNLTAQRYRDEILQPTAVPYLRNMGNDAVLQDDNARPHRARLVRNFLEREGITRMEWPACSPDLNPIEHLWDQLGQSMRKRVLNETTLAGLR